MFKVFNNILYYLYSLLIKINILNGTKLNKAIICLIVAMTSLSCAVIQTDYYSKPIKNSTESNFLLRGDGWKDRKYGYTINNVHQIDTSGLLVALRVNNLLQQTWAVGIWVIPLVPTFGAMKDGYKDNKSVDITIAIFSKTEMSLNIDPCKIQLIINDGQSLIPAKYQLQYIETDSVCKCPGNEVLILNETSTKSYRDMLILNLTYNIHFSPKDKGRIVFPQMQHGNDKIHIPEFKFEKGKGTKWTSIL